jgi:hypothetical protein
MFFLSKKKSLFFILEDGRDAILGMNNKEFENTTGKELDLKATKGNFLFAQVLASISWVFLQFFEPKIRPRLFPTKICTSEEFQGIGKMKILRNVFLALEKSLIVEH